MRPKTNKPAVIVNVTNEVLDQFIHTYDGQSEQSKQRRRKKLLETGKFMCNLASVVTRVVPQAAPYARGVDLVRSAVSIIADKEVHEQTLRLQQTPFTPTDTHNQIPVSIDDATMLEKTIKNAVKDAVEETSADRKLGYIRHFCTTIVNKVNTQKSHKVVLDGVDPYQLRLGCLDDIKDVALAVLKYCSEEGSA